MPKKKKEVEKVELNPADYDDYGDYMAAKKVAESKVKEEKVKEENEG